MFVPERKIRGERFRASVQSEGHVCVQVLYAEVCDPAGEVAAHEALTGFHILQRVRSQTKPLDGSKLDDFDVISVEGSVNTSETRAVLVRPGCAVVPAVVGKG